MRHSGRLVRRKTAGRRESVRPVNQDPQWNAEVEIKEISPHRLDPGPASKGLLRQRTAIRKEIASNAGKVSVCSAKTRGRVRKARQTARVRDPDD